MARPRRKITDEHLRQIEVLAGYGLTEVMIAAVIGIDALTLRRRKADEVRVMNALKNGKAKASAIIGEALFKKAKAGDLGAIVWWEKTRAGRSDRIVITPGDPAVELAGLLGVAVDEVRKLAAGPEIPAPENGNGDADKG